MRQQQWRVERAVAGVLGAWRVANANRRSHEADLALRVALAHLEKTVARHAPELEAKIADEAKFILEAMRR